MINRVVEAGSTNTGDLSTITDPNRDRNNELSDPLGSSAPLYGRAVESDLLLQSFHSHESKIAIVHGKSGSGKTSLVDTLREPVVEDGGYFCAGKYFQNLGVQEPYSALMAAFSDLCDLVAQSPDFAKHRDTIRGLLGSDGELLRKTVTNLSPFLQQESSESFADIRSDMLFPKFKKACKTFLKAMSSAGSIVLFLDDIQWMDEGSRQLVELFLKDTDLKNVMIVLVYRDEDVDHVPSTFTVEQQERVVDIGLDPLDSDAIYEMVSGMLKSNDPSTRQLSEVVFAKTGGNPFHVTQFLNAIERAGLLSMDPTTSKWVFNAHQIQMEIMVEDTLAELLLQKIRRLDPHVQDTLKVAAVMGYRFDNEILLEVALSERRLEQMSPTQVSDLHRTPDSSLASLMSYISLAQEEGFIEKTKDGYQFSHDKLQDAFYQMLNSEEEEQLHLLIGQVYLRRDDDDCVYHAAAHLNRAPCTDAIEQEKLARLNLDAAKFCREKSAFLDAASFLRQGLALIDPAHMWTTQYDLSFEITQLLARLELIAGNLEASKVLTREVLRHSNSKEMEFEARLVQVEVQMAGNEIQESMTTAREALAVLDIKIPRKVGPAQVMWKVLQMKRKLRKKTDEDIFGLPPCDSKAVEAATRLLMKMCLFCFLKGEGLQAVYAALTATELTLLHGLTASSGVAILMFGIVECHNGNHSGGYRFGYLGKRLAGRIGSQETEGATYGVWGAELQHWREPVSNIGAPMSRAVQCGFDTGDMVYTCYSVLNTFVFPNYVGAHLEDVVAGMRNMYNRFVDLSQDSLLIWIQPAYQSQLNLLCSGGDARELILLTGEVMNETRYLEEVVEAGHLVLNFTVWLWKAQLAMHFGAFDAAELLYTEMMSMKQVLSGFFMNFAVTQWHFQGALVHLERYYVTHDKRKLRKARWFKKKLEKIHEEGCPNAVHYLTAIAAEELALKKKVDPEKLAEAFTEAADAMAIQEMPHMEALCNERAGFAFSRLQCKSLARRFFDRSLDLYLNRWGAVAKHENLQERSSCLLSRLSDDLEEPLIVNVVNADILNENDGARVQG